MFKLVLIIRDPVAGLIIGSNIERWWMILVFSMVWAAVSQAPLIIGGSHTLYAEEKGIPASQAFIPFYTLSWLYSSAVTFVVALIVFWIK